MNKVLLRIESYAKYTDCDARKKIASSIKLWINSLLDECSYCKCDVYERMVEFKKIMINVLGPMTN